MRVFAVSGFSFSGKTFLLEQLITRLKEEGFTVATIKKTMEEVEDEEATDTWRHARAGANPTALIGPNSASLRIVGKVSYLDLLDAFSTDFVLLEGFKEDPVPRFWCIGPESEEPEFTPSHVKAIVVWEGERYEQDNVPVISNSQIDRLVEIIKQEALDVSTLKAQYG